MTTPTTTSSTTACTQTQSQSHRRNSSNSSSSSSHHDRPSMATCPDPLAALERDLLAHPTTHHYAHSHHHFVPAHHEHGFSHANQEHGHLAPPVNAAAAAAQHSRTPSPSPTPAARRCMEATAAWMPSLDRRQSWDDQAYRRAMMLQGTGLACECHPGAAAEGQGQGPAHVLHHHRHGCTAQSVYEADRGFSEVRPRQ